LVIINASKYDMKMDLDKLTFGNFDTKINVKNRVIYIS